LKIITIGLGLIKNIRIETLKNNMKIFLPILHIQISGHMGLNLNFTCMALQFHQSISHFVKPVRQFLICVYRK